MKLYTIYFSNGSMTNVMANGVNFYKDVVIDMEFFIDGNVVAEFNSEQIAGYTVKDVIE